MKILSWNICWGCMSADKTSKNDVTAAKLALQCKKRNEEGGILCIDYVTDFLKHNDYDIIALQESKNWNCIYLRLSERYNYVNFEIRTPWDPTVKVDITTFFDKKKYRFLGGYFGNILETDARPYQFMLFLNLEKNRPFYFLNIHNGHLISSKTLQAVIESNNLFIENKKYDDVNISLLPPPSKEVSSSRHSWLINNIQYIPENRQKDQLPIIMAGDFNDGGKYNYWKGITINETKLLSNSQPPTTCCTPVKNKYTWLAAPSIIFDPNIRIKILGVEIKFVFDITTFSSTACVGDNGKKGKNYDYSLCETNEALNELCYIDKYRSHEPFQGKRPYEKLLTDIDEVKRVMINEQAAIDAQFPGQPYQRYNEVLAYFFPWEIFGIEVGGREISVSIETQKIIVEESKKLIDEYSKLLSDSDKTNSILAIINDDSKISSNTIRGGEYLLVKYFKFYKCSNKGIEIVIDFFLEKINMIIQQLTKPINLYEYGKIPDEQYFSLYEINDNSRSTDFELFKQESDDNFLTHIIKYTNDQFNSTMNKASPPRDISRNFNYEQFMSENKYPLFARSALLNTTEESPFYGKVNIEDFVNEIFQGRLYKPWFPGGYINLVINPATVILPKTNVIITSQIFDREFELNKIIKSTTNYDDYSRTLIIHIRTNEYNNDIKIGDYILHDINFVEIQPNQVPSMFDKSMLSSDHLPVESTLEFRKMDGGYRSKGGLKNKKSKKRFILSKTKIYFKPKKRKVRNTKKKMRKNKTKKL